MRHRDIIIAKIDLFIQRITHNLWTAREKNVTLIKQINDLKMCVNEYIGDCTDEELNDREFIASVVDRAIFISRLIVYVIPRIIKMRHS